VDYKIIKKLAAGGFAEVFLATAEAAEGFSKFVAIKRILPNLTNDDENKETFVKMFLDEARLWARLNHNNIVQVFDLGTGIDNNDSFFIVMEYVDGANLELIMKGVRKKGYQIPIHHSVFIIMQTLEGLYYAHTRKDNDNQPLNVVHRDISPPNIIMTSDGHVKITDFGLAKATTQLEKTSPNSLKGKIDYMSPEQAKGETVDQRTDIFATGILLYELLSNKKLYSNKATRETLDIVQKADIKSIREINPNVQPELEVILKKALAPNAKNRYQTALEFQNDLAIYIFKNNLKVITHDVSQSLIQAFTYKKEIDKVKQNKEDMIDQLIMNALFKIKTIQEGDNVKDIIASNIELIDADKPLNIFTEEDELKQSASIQFDKPVGKSNSSNLLIILLLLVFVVIAIVALVLYLK